jgi:hypothetical protein
MSKIKLKTFDIWGRESSEDENFALKRTILVGEHYRQYGVAGANHVLDGSMDFVIEEIEGWLEQ